jgi:predicted alpha/beta-fold hydrolase
MMGHAGQVEAFRPPPLWGGTHLQSVLASLPLRRPLVERRAREMIAASSDMILDCGRGVRLHGYYTPRKDPDQAPPRGLAVLLHGWEGSAQSLYALSTASHLRGAGYDVFRLNMRDHGPSHHLNPELFHSNRLAEVVGAVKRLQATFPDRPIYLAGFSLGGNFALRVGLRAPSHGIDVRQIVAVCPVLEPEHTLDALEAGWFGYRQYFLKKWRRSLMKKMGAYPSLYDFSDVGRIPTLTELTAFFVDNHSGFHDLRAYLKGYALTGDVLAPLRIPSHILFARDDPVIPARDLARIARPECLSLTVTEQGGHCGFVESYRLGNWAERQIARLFDQAGAG